MENNTSRATTCSSCVATLSTDSRYRTCRACRERGAASRRKYRVEQENQEGSPVRHRGRPRVGPSQTIPAAYISQLSRLRSLGLGGMDKECLRWIDERQETSSLRNPSWASCYKRGSVQLWNKPQKLKFKTYINKQKETQEIVKGLFDNSIKYGISSTVGAKNQNPNKSKHVPLPPADLPFSSQWKRIIAFGNGSFCSSMKGKRAAPTERSTEKVKRKCKQSNGRGTEFVSVDEYLTSQICNKCKMKEMNNFSVSGSKRRVHSVLKCESCGTVWNRDVNSTLDIYGIFVYKSKHDNESPPPPSNDLQRTNYTMDLMRCP